MIFYGEKNILQFTMILLMAFRFSEEIQDCFKQVTFIQIFVSLVALCMSEVLLLIFWDDSILFMHILPYFLTISLLMFQICYAGNELTYAVSLAYHPLI